MKQVPEMNVRNLFCFSPLLKSNSLVTQAGKEDKITESKEDLVQSLCFS